MIKKIKNWALARKKPRHPTFTIVHHDGSKHTFVDRHHSFWDKFLHLIGVR